MKKAFLLVLILMVSVISTACINNFAVQELNNKAQEYLSKGDYQSAIGSLKSSIDLDNTIYETHYNLGIAYTKAEDYSDAVDEFEKTIELNPNFAMAYYSLAVAYENKAKTTINPPAKEDDDEDNTDVSFDENGKKVLSDDDKQDIVDDFSKAIDAYNKYLDRDSEKKDEVNSKIEYLQNEITKYMEN